MIKLGHMVLKELFGCTIQKSVHMVLNGLKWVHNDKIGSNGLKKSQLGTHYKYRGYLLRQVVFHFTEKSMDFSI